MIRLVVQFVKIEPTRTTRYPTEFLSVERFNSALIGSGSDASILTSILNCNFVFSADANR